ncbi:hypothetical protein J2T57_001503 [Natronocella acetinitrilica]|uniref:Uncharacterized protein n=1 Tax=Natronocella acetinitrilica TaxID=414046 RepID=A0AAE3G268_9GAMM|nr:hypothetical protein [Natronocella acetinitrilica]MCP1674401.1 hypothetical protein [Natronocella acetinitrilica]
MSKQTQYRDELAQCADLTALEDRVRAECYRAGISVPDESWDEVAARMHTEGHPLAAFFDAAVERWDVLTGEE